VIPSEPAGTRALLPPFEDPLAGRIDELVDEVQRLGDRIEDLARGAGPDAELGHGTHRRGWRRCGARIGRVLATARSGASQLVGIGAALALDVTELALGTARELFDAAFGSPPQDFGSGQVTTEAPVPGDESRRQ
jgi:hypothetical protein